MTKSKLGIVSAVVVGLLLLGYFAFGGGNLGAKYNNVVVDFSEGISVDGTTVIDGARAISAAAITATTGTFSGAVSALAPVEVMTADDTLTVAESGKTFYIGTAGVDLTLPTVSTAAGVRYKVVISANFATTNATIVSGGSANVIEGAVDVNSALVACATEDTISFVNTAELPGDYVIIESDGTNWYVYGQAVTAGAITCTQAS